MLTFNLMFVNLSLYINEILPTWC